MLDRSGFTFEVQAGLAWTHEDYPDDRLDTEFATGVLLWELKRTLPTGIRLFHNGEWSPSLREFNDIQLLTTETGLRTDITGGWFLEAKLISARRFQLDAQSETESIEKRLQAAQLWKTSGFSSPSAALR